VGHGAWMPTETKYDLIFETKRLNGYIAQPVYIILSKAKYSPKKNKKLILEYIASKDFDPKLNVLAEKYKINIEVFYE
jgi:hypothetical protein